MNEKPVEKDPLVAGIAVAALIGLSLLIVISVIVGL